MRKSIRQPSENLRVPNACKAALPAALAGLILTACAGGYGGGGAGAGHPLSPLDAKRVEEVRATADRMVADARTASANREVKYRQEAGAFKDIRDKLCKLATQTDSDRGNQAKIAADIKSVKSDFDRLRTVTMDAASRVQRRSEANDTFIAADCKNPEPGSDNYFQCSSMEHARAWQEVIEHELSDLNTINDSAAGWTVGSLECLEAGLTKRLEKDDLDLAGSIRKSWVGYRNRRIISAQALDDASLQFSQAK